MMNTLFICRLFSTYFSFIFVAVLLPISNILYSTSLLGDAAIPFSIYDVVGLAIVSLYLLPCSPRTVVLGIGLYAYGAEITTEEEEHPENQAVSSVKSLLMPLQFD